MAYSTPVGRGITLVLVKLSQQERGQFPRVSKLHTTGISCALSWTLLGDASSVTFLVHFVHLSGRAQLAHSAFSCCVCSNYSKKQIKKYLMRRRWEVYFGRPFNCLSSNIYINVPQIRLPFCNLSLSTKRSEGGL